MQTPIFDLNADVCGGLERVEMEEVARLNQIGHHATLSVPRLQFRSAAVPSYVRTIPDWGWDRRVLKWKYLTHFYLQNISADVLHGHYTTGLPLLAGNRAVIHFHGFAVRELPLYRYRWAREKYNKSNYVFCAKHLIDKFVSFYQDIHRDRLHLLHNGIDHVRFSHKNRKKRGESTVFSYHGRWVKHKGIMELLQAVEILEKKKRKFICLIAGSPDVGCAGADADIFGAKVRETASRLKNVKLVGKIEYNDLPAFLQEVDFGVVPSTYEDPFPLAPLELMSCGKPVVAFPLGGLKEMVIDGRNGLLTDKATPQDLARAIDEMLGNPGKRREMGRNARRIVEERFTWDIHVSKLMEIYRIVIESGTGRKRP